MGREIFNGSHVQIFGRDQSTGNANSVSLSDGAVHVLSPAEVPGALAVYELSNVNTRQKIDIAVPASAVDIVAIDMGSSSAKVFDVVFNAANDAAADANLAVAGARAPLPTGKSYQQYVQGTATKISRIDIKARVAETGSNLIVVFARS